MISYRQIHENLKNGKINIDDLQDDKAEYFAYGQRAVTNSRVDLKELKAFLMICLDYYTYSENGDVLIPDRLYDECTRRYYREQKDATQIIYADEVIDASHWGFIDHKIPGVVGSLPKIYTYEEVKDYYHGMGKHIRYRLSPKYDGVSVSIEIIDGRIYSGATRYNGLKGQDITALVKRVANASWFGKKPDGFYKCELLMSTAHYNELVKEKRYANRRSAVSGIVNTPKNLHLAKYITAVPLLYYNSKKQDRRFIAPEAIEVEPYSARDLMDEIEQKLEQIRSNDFPFRVDGIVITPLIDIGINEGDLMEDSIAYKVNTNEAKTRIEYGYMSVGVLGGATPMLHVEPVEVNETIVRDVSLGSYAKFLSMDLKEHEEVIVYSAGDVIPQVKLPSLRTNWNNEDDLRIDKHCPYCGEKFERNGTEYRCANPHCPRVVSGRISNFMAKLGVMGYSDKTIEVLHSAGLIDKIEDLFSIHAVEIMAVPGFDEISAHGFVDEIAKLKAKPISVSTLFGALGIEGISMKKCKKIFEQISLRKLLKNPEKRKLQYQMQAADGIGPKTAAVFIEFVTKNYGTIDYLLRIMNIVSDVQSIGKICFTGFRSSEWESKFNDIGYEVENSVTRDTEVLISANDDLRSTKCQTAMSKGVPIFAYRDIENVYKHLKSGRRIKGEMTGLY
ncbi:MAG: hypothetical protein NC548_06115 [Lachnospiraceae bacterium]|nr:hypothetical protein [Lachnospiraceae bacterium]